MFYTSVALEGSKILYRGITSDGKKSETKIDFKPSFFIPDENGEYKTLDGTKNLSEKEFSDVWAARKYISDHENVDNFDIYGQNQFQNLFIQKYFPGEISFDISKICVANIDIETTCENGFPDIEKAEEIINAITYYESDSDTYRVFSNKEFGEVSIPKDLYPNKTVVVEQGENEREMLLLFMAKWTKNYPDIVTGYNCEFFDVPYLVNRIRNIFGEKKVQSLSPWNKVKPRTVNRPNGRMEDTYSMRGISILDYMDLYKKFSYTPQESYSLNHIAHMELGEKKLEHEGLHLLYKNDYQKFIEYNIQDVFLVQNLENKRKFIEFVITLSYMAKINYKDCFFPVRIIESICHNFLYERKIIPPVKTKQGAKDSQYSGAYVKDPHKGMHDFVSSFDLNSLYPSIIRQLNLSPETLKPEHYNSRVGPNSLLKDDVDLNYLRDKNLSLAANGHHFTRDYHGFLPQVIENILTDRKKVKSSMIQEEKRLALIEEEISKRKSQ